MDETAMPLARQSDAISGEAQDSTPIGQGPQNPAIPSESVLTEMIQVKSDQFISYAQNFEDLMLWCALQHVRNGSYIDIGAGEPDADSVTKAFYERGWRGINVEPVDSTFGRLASARPDERNLQVLVGDHEGVQNFFMIGEGNGLSTADSGLAARHAAAGWPCRTSSLPVTTLTRICEQYVHREVHFLKIDAEWSELAILNGMDFRRFRPWIVLFEATPIGTAPHSFEDCDRVLEQAGYRFLYADGLNRFWGANERYADLAPHFGTPPNVFDRFVRSAEISARQDAEAARNKAEAARSTLLTAQGKLARAEAERDAVAQELFEANRHAAYLTVERQKLIGEIEHLRGWLQMVYTSTTWKIGRPVRLMKRILARHPR